MPIGMLNFMAEEFSDNALKEFLKDNQDGVTSLEETENWDYITLFPRTFSRTVDYLFFI
jgi:hypothetical protein